MQAKDGVVVYDLLKRLESVGAKEAGVQLITLAGQLGSVLGGYFFEKKSVEYLEGVCETPVFDESDQQVGTIPGPGCFFSYVYQGMGVPKHVFDPISHTYRMEPPVSEQESDALWDMRAALLGQIKARGEEACDEYRLVAAAMGGERLDAEELKATITRVLGT